MKRCSLVSVMILTALVLVVPVQAEPSTAEQVKGWTVRQWNRAVAEFRKDDAK